MYTKKKESNKVKVLVQVKEILKNFVLQCNPPSNEDPAGRN